MPAPEPAELLASVRSLLQAPAPTLGDVERTLADGYAAALSLDAERLRLQRRLEREARELTPDAPQERVGSLADLAARIGELDEETGALRSGLAELREKARRLQPA